MTPDSVQPTRRSPPNLRLAAIAFYLAAACSFVAGLLNRQTPWFNVIGGLNAVCGSIMLIRMRKATVRTDAASRGRG